MTFAPPPLSAVESRILKDIAYLGAGREEKLDAYLPPAAYAGPHPAVLVIHGGGWRIGDKAQGREINFGKTLSEHGYAVFSINYLLNAEEKDPVTGKMELRQIAWPQNFYDCKTALRWIRAEAARYQVDPARIAVMGGSAGGHLAMLVGATAGDEAINRHGLHTEQSNAVSCILNFYGEYDVRGQSVSPLDGAGPEVTAAQAAAASPITYLDANTPPIFVTHGTADNIIPVERSRMLAAHLSKLGAEFEYIELADAPHSYDLQPKQRDLRPAVLSFLEKHLGRPTARSGSDRPASFSDKP